nr:RDD family protein [uncultured Roseateles sp.]
MNTAPPASESLPAAFDARAWVTPEDLNVTPSLLGLPLATPKQRALAMGIDLAVLVPFSNLGNFFLLMAIGAGFLLLLRHRAAQANPAGPKRRQVGLWILLAFSLSLGLPQAWDDWHAPEPVKYGKALPGASDGEESEDAPASGAQVTATEVSADPSAPGASAAAAAVPASAAALTAQQQEQKKQAQHIARLEAQVKAQQAEIQAHHFDPRAAFKRIVNEVGLSYFWALLYFSLLPVFWPGQTLGKKLLGLKVVELTGKTLTPMICFKRYGGYAAGMATGMTGFVQLFWDSNRQAIQDKTAHTVVIDARSSKRLALPEAA